MALSPPKGPQGPRWEYLEVYEKVDQENEMVEPDLNTLGEEGWELVFVRERSQDRRDRQFRRAWVFKREKEKK